MNDHALENTTNTRTSLSHAIKLVESGRNADVRAGLGTVAAAYVAGSGRAAFVLGSCLIEGRGIARDTEGGLRLIGQSAAKGHAPAVLFMARYHEERWRQGGKVCREQLRSALRLWERGAALGVPGAQVGLGALLIEIGARLGEAYSLLSGASRRGDARATYLLSVMYRRGIGPVASDDVADRLLAKAAEMGDPDALRLLGA